MTEFERKVYKEVKEIPYGEVMTYKEIAVRIGNPNACRAVGNALHKNPFPTEVPCYRVVNAKGYLTKSFAFGGMEIQKQKLEEEGIKVLYDEKQKAYRILLAQKEPTLFF